MRIPKSRYQSLRKYYKFLDAQVTDSNEQEFFARKISSFLSQVDRTNIFVKNTTFKCRHGQRPATLSRDKKAEEEFIQIIVQNFRTT